MLGFIIGEQCSIIKIKTVPFKKKKNANVQQIPKLEPFPSALLDKYKGGGIFGDVRGSYWMRVCL